MGKSRDRLRRSVWLLQKAISARDVPRSVFRFSVTLQVKILLRGRCAVDFLGRKTRIQTSIALTPWCVDEGATGGIRLANHGMDLATRDGLACWIL